MMIKMMKKVACVVAALCCVGFLSAQKFVAGDVVLSDGSVVSWRSLKNKEQFPIGVVAGVNADGSALIVGTRRSSDSIAWAIEGSTGHGTKFSAVACDLKGKRNSSGGGSAEHAEFSGATDGSKTWQEICARDTSGTSVQNAAHTYPAFSFAQNYGAQFSLSGEYLTGWHLPSVSELCLIYKNRHAINDALRNLHRLDAALAMDGLGTNWYWSSSQSPSRAEHAWFVHFVNGYAGECPKDFTNLHALAVRTISR